MSAPYPAEPRILSDRYEVHQLLGRGGMAEVHEGLDTRLGRRVAIKLLRSDLARDSSFQARLKREAQSAAGLNHPGIVAVYDSGEETFIESGGSQIQVPFIVMEYVEGQTLRSVLDDHEKLTVREALDVVAGVLAPLDYSHRHGIVHRDIKPANVMLSPEGDIKVMDFGIARVLEDTGSMTQTHSVVGTAQYLSPEQARGEIVDARSDLYSTACMLYELLCGRPPFVGDSQLAVAYQHVGEEPTPPSHLVGGIPQSVDRMVMHALNKNKTERYQDAHTFREDIVAARDGLPLSIDNDATETRALSGFAAGAGGASALAGGEDAPTQAYQATPATEAYSQIDPATQAYGAVPPSGMGVEAGAGEFATSQMSYTGYPAGGHPGGDASTAMQQTIASPDSVRGAPRRNRRNGGNAWTWVGVALIVLALAGIGLWFYTQFKEPPVQSYELLDLRDRDADEAEKFLQKLNLQVVRQEKYDDEIAKGNVIGTNPPAGTTVKEGDRITLEVSRGPDTVKIPDVAGDSESLARQKLNEAGLTAGSNIEQNSPEVEGDNVIETKPGADEEVKKGSTVDLVISTGRVEVPDVTGKSADAACAALEADDYQLKCEVVTQVTSEHPAGEVFTQSTSAGSQVDQHSVITVTVAKKPEPEPEPTPEPVPSGESDSENKRPALESE